MKMIKVDKCICLLTAIVCLILFATSSTVFAAQNDGNTEVIARVETVPNETTHPPANDGGFDSQDESNVPTGGTISVCVVIALLVLMISALVIFLCNNKSKDVEAN